ncbi:uncharacterized protein LOC100906051 [Galendromus occidentalis]|uniref:Uncharacterized protein LOC100906051 n=1 Tax=Galendromus occidentalis TaxID=34638 RepID=A0AAJ7L2T1_9ACAR|nr:uncharacterized protein LOC100906051 [Galendromus occidentalis]
MSPRIFAERHPKLRRAMDSESESPEEVRESFPLTHKFPLEAVVSVEWYSLAQLEYLADKIRKSQPVENLLLPIPKTLTDPPERATSSKDMGWRKKVSLRISSPRSAKASMDSFVDEDLSMPLTIASPPSTYNSPVKAPVESKEDPVTITVNNMVDMIASPKKNLFHEKASLGSTCHGDASGGDGTATQTEAKKIVKEARSRDPNVDSRRNMLTTNSSERSGAPRPEGTSTLRYHLFEGEAYRNIHDDDQFVGAKRPQRYHRKMVPSVPQAAVLLHEPDIEKDPPWLQAGIREKLAQFVVVVSSKSGFDGPHGSQLQDMKLERVDPSTIAEILMKVRVARPVQSNPLGTSEPIVDPAERAAPTRENIKEGELEEISEAESRLRRELFDLLYDTPHKGLSLDDLFDDAHQTILMELSNEVHLTNEKLRLLSSKRSLSRKLTEILKKTKQQQRKRSRTYARPPQKKQRSQAHLEGQVRMQQVREHCPATVVHLTRPPDDFPAATAVNAKGVKPVPPAPTNQQVLSFHRNDQAVFLTPSMNFQIIRPATTSAPSFFTVRQPYIARPP